MRSPRRTKPPLAALAALLLAAGCQSVLEPSAADRRASFRNQKDAFTGDSVRCILETYLVIACDEGVPDPTYDSVYGKIHLPPLPQGSFAQGLAVGIDPAGYLLTARHLVRAKTFVLGWIDGRPAIRRAVAVAAPGADVAILRISGRLDYWARIGGLPRVGDAVFAVVCDRTGVEVGGRLRLAGGSVLEAWSGSHGPERVATDVPLWHGDSGGPLLAANGDLVAINSALHFSLLARGRLLGDYERISFLLDPAVVQGAVSGNGKTAPAGAR
jgi:S1-C subfamily serine protease